jgi:hypothetical protein
MRNLPNSSRFEHKSSLEETKRDLSVLHPFYVSKVEKSSSEDLNRGSLHTGMIIHGGEDDEANIGP